MKVTTRASCPAAVLDQVDRGEDADRHRDDRGDQRHHQRADDRVVGAAAGLTRASMPRWELGPPAAARAACWQPLAQHGVRGSRPAAPWRAKKRGPHDDGRQDVLGGPAAGLRPPSSRAIGGRRRRRSWWRRWRCSFGEGLPALDDDAGDRVDQRRSGRTAPGRRRCRRRSSAGCRTPRRCSRSSTRRSRRRRRATQIHAGRRSPGGQDDHDGDRLAERAAEAEHRGGDDAGLAERQHRGADHLPLGGAERQGGLLVGSRASARTPRGTGAVMIGRIMMASTSPR